MLPVTGATAGVCDCDDVDVYVAHSVNDFVRKSIEPKFATRPSACSGCSDFGARSYQLNRSHDGIMEVTTQFRPPALIPTHRLSELG
jgi:hypothetical protein